MTRTIIAIIAGIIIAFVVVSVMELLDYQIYKAPPGTPDSIIVSTLPVYIKWLVLFGWVLGALAGGMVAAAINPQQKMSASVITGLLFMLATLLNLLQFPHPVWMWVIGLWQAIPFAYSGSTFVKQKSITQ